jgi:hypothetical protein
MTRADQFESVFRAAARRTLEYAPVDLRRVLVVTDLSPDRATDFTASVQSFLGAICEPNQDDAICWETVSAGAYTSVQSLLDLVEQHKPDLICTYRNLGTEAWRFGHTIGDHLAVLTQATTVPVLTLPHPGTDQTQRRPLNHTKTVMAITDHLAGDDRLVNMAAHFTAPGGRLLLAHVEDQIQFARYIDAISKIPEIDTDMAKERVMERLLKGPTDFIASCRQTLAEQNLSIEVHDIVTLGHRLREYKSLIESHSVDLLVFHTKDDDQFAMHGLAYPLAVELRDVPLLMI